jgi:hypothetical protein
VCSSPLGDPELNRIPVELVALLSALALAQPAAARLLRTGPTPLENWNPLVALTIGSSVEYERGSDQPQYEFPFFVEYSLTPALKATIEPTVVHLLPEKGSGRSVTGTGDMETALDYEFLRERRYRPALTAEGIVRWPTATKPDLGDPGRDYSIGLIASKDLVFVEFDLRLLYTFLADQKSQNAFELSLGGQWHLNYLVDLEAEVAHSFGGGMASASLISPGSGGVINLTGADLTEGTVGLAWHINKRLKLEHGAVFTSDGTWRLVLAWEFSFGGD